MAKRNANATPANNGRGQAPKRTKRVDKQHETTTAGKLLGGVTGKGFMPGQSGNPKGRKPLAVTIGQHVRDIGDEVIDERTQWTRIDAVIRRLYADAISGKHQHAEIILERGWGKVPQPVQLDVTEELRRLMQELNLTPTDIASDPALSMLFGMAGVKVDKSE